MTLLQTNNKPLLNVYISAGGSVAYENLFLRAGYKLADKPGDADIVCFTGGWDVNPLLYGETPIQGTSFSRDRDKKDIEVYRLSQDKLKIGICRGGQFLNVMNGGKLWQDVDGHALLATHKLVDQFTNQEIEVTSTHHQMFRPSRKAIIIGLARESRMKKSAHQSWRIKNNNSGVDEFMKRDFEVVYYPTTKSLCFQPHPEFEFAHTTREYFYNVLRRIIDGSIQQEDAARKAAIKAAKG